MRFPRSYSYRTPEANSAYLGTEANKNRNMNESDPIDFKPATFPKTFCHGQCEYILILKRILDLTLVLKESLKIILFPPSQFSSQHIRIVLSARLIFLPPFVAYLFREGFFQITRDKYISHSVLVIPSSYFYLLAPLF